MSIITSELINKRALSQFRQWNDIELKAKEETTGEKEEGCGKFSPHGGGICMTTTTVQGENLQEATVVIC